MGSSSTLKESSKLCSHAGFRTLFLFIAEGQRKCEFYTAVPVYHGDDVHEFGIAEKKEIVPTSRSRWKRKQTPFENMSDPE